MNLTGLNFDNIPSIHIPFRFFLAASIMAIIAGVFIIIFAEQIWLSRWTPATLSITHLLVLGVTAMIMFGALFQLLPVLCGASLSIPNWKLLIIQTGFTLGIFFLVAGFFQQFSFLPALLLLGFSNLFFVATLIYTLLFKAQGLDTKNSIVLAALSFLITIILGFIILSDFIWSIWGIGKSLTDLHATFGLAGWVLILVVTVGFQVIPMFHVTPEFHHTFKQFLPKLIFVGLIIFLLATSFRINELFAISIIVLSAITFSVYALINLHQRKRKLPDNTIVFWQLGLINLIVSGLLLLINCFIDHQYKHFVEIAIGLFFIIGFALSIIQGMLLKIIPFLITLHLQQQSMKKLMSEGGNMIMIPDHYQLISRQQGRALLFIHSFTLLSLLAGFINVNNIKLGGLFLILNWGLMFTLIVMTVKKYQKTQVLIRNS